ncbi:hypothetical protein [Streptomyces sp. NBRC 14336]|uniref:hypothetical protein n=1 Tax=Streptomyces sp. NBRC 14336 TaxID=3030992 RepID=UPI002556A57C|nr:hypothetical protein [Streptomyces sp. NBRC 14336]
MTIQQAIDLAASLRRRREAADRCPPFDCGHRDPLDCIVQRPGPSKFGLTETELRRHANQLVASGWSVEDVLTRLDISTRNPERNH